MFQIILIINVILFTLILILYFILFGSMKLANQQNEWLLFFDFITKPMTFIVAVSALILSYFNYSINKKKYTQDHIQSKMDRKLKMLEDLYPRYINLKEKYEISYSEFINDFRIFQEQRERFGGDYEARFATDEEFKAMWHPYKKALLDMVDCQLTAFYIAKKIVIDNDETKRIIRHYSTIFDYQIFNDSQKLALQIQQQKPSEPDLVDIIEMNNKLKSNTT